MDDKKLVLNLLVFAEKIKKGLLQSELLQEVADLGFSQVEVRREYFKNFETELPVIKSEAERLNLTLFYSVPDEVYVSGEINPQLERYLDEAKQMGVKQIKWNIGDFDGELHQEKLKALIDKGVIITVENDQTQKSGTISAIQTFLEVSRAAELPVGYVYDLGNWRFVGENEEQAAEVLKDFVSYIHVKDVRYIEGKPQAVGLDHGDLDWRKVLAVLPKDIPIAIEYPTSTKTEILQAKEKLEEEV